MNPSKPLFLYEEILLLALRNKKGTVSSSYSDYLIAGAVLAEALLDRLVSITDPRKQLIGVNAARATGDPIIDQCLQRIRVAKRRASLRTWVSRLAGIKDLRHKVARQLCRRGILRADEDKILFLFTRRTYPEINPQPEREIIRRLRRAILTDTQQINPRTVVLISLANSANLLGENLGPKEIRPRKKRIQQIIKGEMIGKATGEVITACQAAVMVATITPVLVATTSH